MQRSALTPATLDTFGAFTSGCPDETQALTASLLGGPHSLEFNSGAREFDAEFRAFRLSADILFFTCSYGGAVNLRVPELPFGLLQTPICGRLLARSADQSVVHGARMGSMVGGGKELHLEFERETLGLGTAISPGALERTLSNLLGVEPARPLEFEIGSPMDGIRSGEVHVTIASVVRQIESDSPMLRSSVARAQIVEHLLLQILYAQRNSYSELLAAPAPASAPRHVRLVEAYIEAHPDRPMRLADLVRVSGVSARSLHEGFRRFRQTTPMKALREVRLRHVHTALQRADPSETTVADVAARWGFVSMGRFAGNYRQRYGESPSATLRSRRRCRRAAES